MRFTAFVILMFSLSLVFWMLGYQSAFSAIIDDQSTGCADIGGLPQPCPQDLGSMIINFISKLLSDDELGLMVLGTIAVGTVASLFLGFGSMYIIPPMLLYVAAQWFILPLSFLVSPDLPAEIRIPLFILFNLLQLIMIVTFTRGGG